MHATTPLCDLTQQSARPNRDSADRIDTYTPTRPLPLRHNLISAIVALFGSSHLSGPREVEGPPRSRNLLAFHGRSSSQNFVKKSGCNASFRRFVVSLSFGALVLFGADVLAPAKMFCCSARLVS